MQFWFDILNRRQSNSVRMGEADRNEEGHDYVREAEVELFCML